MPTTPTASDGATSTATSSGGPSPNTPSSAAASSAVTSFGSLSGDSVKHGKSGLSSNAAAGVGVGVAIGLIILGLAAFFFWRKRRRVTRAQSPYNPVLSNEKGLTDSVSYSSPNISPPELHPIPPVATAPRRNFEAQETSYEPMRHTTMSDEGPPPKYPDDIVSALPSEPDELPPAPQQYQAYVPPQQRPMTSRDISRASTPPRLNTQNRPATAFARLADEPPSPVSPVSPVSSMGSRPASLRRTTEHHE